MDSLTVKNIAAEAGADLCGIAPAERFKGSPAGFHPKDYLPGCNAVVVLACRFPHDAIEADPDTYTAVRNAVAARIDAIAEAVAGKMTAAGLRTRSVKSLDVTLDKDRYRGPVSLKHAAVMAGLGRIGKNTLLINDSLGSMLWLSAVLTDGDLACDALASYEACPQGCHLCVDKCPAGALGMEKMNQIACLNHAFVRQDGKLSIRCWECRKVCPLHFGITAPQEPI